MTTEELRQALQQTVPIIDATPLPDEFTDFDDDEVILSEAYRLLTKAMLRLLTKAEPNDLLLAAEIGELLEYLETS